MKQILQSLRTGTIEVADVPTPAARRGHLVIRTRRTLVSAGTERMLLEFGKAGWLDKARQQPDKVRQVIEKVRTDGLLPMIEAVRSKLDQPLALGYCNVGVVQDLGDGIGGFARGDRVASNGRHAEVVSVPKHLCARIPNSVSDDEAAFTVVGAIALQGIRLAQPTLGEAVVVTGLGLIGLITVQLLRAHGCRVLGVDFDAHKLDLARSFGAEVVDLAAGGDAIAAAQVFSRGRGVDAVVITASTHSSEPVHQAALMCRKRGRIVLVGVTGLELSRADFYEKELTFQVSCSYGPGRYDPAYEEQGLDYPVGFVRWTEQRNFEAVLDMMADGRLDVKPLISHRVAIAEAEKAYALLSSGEPSLGILLEYPAASSTTESRTVTLGQRTTPGATQVAVSFIGSGNFATGVLIPAFRAAGARLRCIASVGGVSSWYGGRKFGFEEATTDADRVLADTETTAVVIATRHDVHAPLVLRALETGKHVFVEKPLCLTVAELETIETRYRELASVGRAPILMVGFNRRFAPHVAKIRSLLAGIPGPRASVMTVNAGAIPSDHWTQDPRVGGGRILGEVCHFVDLLRFLTGSRISSVQASGMGGGGQAGDTLAVTLRFEDGSIGAIQYFANGHRSFPKERLDVFTGGRVLHLDNFRRLRGFGWPKFRAMSLWRQDKGHRAEAKAFLDAVRDGSPAPIPFDELVEVTRATFDVLRALTR